MTQTQYVDQHYVPHVEAARARSAEHPSLQALLGEGLDATEQLASLIEFCAIGVRVLRPLEDTLRRAASVSLTMGRDELAQQLLIGSRRAGERRLLLVDDLVQLAQLWRQQVLGGESRLDLRSLVHQSAPPAAARQVAWLEDSPLDELPFLALGVLIELGEFARSFGTQLMRASEAKLGSEIFECMGYIQAAAEDAALAQDGLRASLDDILRVSPDFGELIAAVGLASVEARIEVWATCVRRGAALVHADNGAELQA